MKKTPNDLSNLKVFIEDREIKDVTAVSYEPFRRKITTADIKLMTGVLPSQKTPPIQLIIYGPVKFHVDKIKKDKFRKNKAKTLIKVADAIHSDYFNVLRY